MREPSMSDRASWPRLTIVVALAVVLGATGAFLIAVPQRSSGEPIAAPADPPTTTTTQAPTTTTTTAAPTTTSIVAAPTTTTAPQAPPATKPTSPPRPRPPAKPVPTTARSAASVGGSQLDQVESIADSSGWDWRKVHVHFRIGFYPSDCCHWGVYDPYDHKTIWIGPTAFDNATRLRYVVLHELAHAWQWHSHRLKKLSADMAPWGYQDVDALEAGADCIATQWGADAASGHYWTCPPAAQELMARRLAGDWKG
ncbi:MAG TPA: hypothetical protein VG034_13580 [Acidimicrobiia bacterium]|nr:hypothetical protein [Acidimicrobiia bacterium]